MSIQKYFEEMKVVQSSLLQYIEDEDKEQENYNSLIQIINDLKFLSDVQKFRSLLQLISNISDNHQRCHNFINKLQQILMSFREEIKNTFSNIEIFNIFKNSKRIILFFIEEKIIEIDLDISYLIKTNEDLQSLKYNEYLYPELKPFSKINSQNLGNYHYYNEFSERNDEDFSEEIKEAYKKFTGEDMNNDAGNIMYDDRYYFQEEEEEEKSLEFDENFYENRRKGENLTKVCLLIQKDLIDDFIVYVNKMNLPLNGVINQSIFETHSFLLQRNTTLIEYAAFCGAIQIFQYLITNKVEISSSLWIYAIHSNKPEMIQKLEENSIIPLDPNYTDCLIESIKCYHIKITDYLLNNYVKIELIGNGDKGSIENYYIRFYNFDIIPEYCNFKDILFDLIEYENSYIVNFLLDNDIISALSPMTIKVTFSIFLNDIHTF